MTLTTAAAVALMAGLIALLALPALIAGARRHPERKTIYRLTPLSALSLLLWFALIVWAASDRRDDATITRLAAKLRGRRLLPALVLLLVVFGAAGSIATFTR